MSLPLTPPPLTGNGVLDRWLALLFKKLSGAAQILWSQIDTTGSNTPAGNISATTIQAAINELDTEKLAKSGDTASTLTITSADINGGTIDATSIGATTPSTGAFTTLSATGNTTLGDATSDVVKISGNTVVPNTSGYGIQVDTTTPTFGWRDLLGEIQTRPAAGAGASALPDYVAYRGNIYGYRFGTVAPNNHLHEAFLVYHVPHDYVPSSDLFVHVHWSQTTVDTGGTAGAPGVAKWYFDITYADGHGTAGGSADPFIAPFTVSVTQQGSTTQYGHMIAEVQFTGASLAASTIQVDGLIMIRVYRDPTDVADTLDQDTFVHFVDVHYQSTNIATKNKSPNFYS